MKYTIGSKNENTKYKRTKVVETTVETAVHTHFETMYLIGTTNKPLQDHVTHVPDSDAAHGPVPHWG